MQRFGFIPGRERGSALSPGLCLLRAQSPGEQTPTPAQHCTHAGSSLPSPLGDDISPRPPHNVTDKETEACGDGGFLSADQ